jgi:hypothetical protein
MIYPFGPMGIPVSMLGAPYTGSALSAVSPIPTSPNYILTVLATARAAGAQVLLSLQGGAQNFVNLDGSFSLTLWEQQVDLYNGIDLSSYIAGGTLKGSPFIDEPQDVSNWGGHTVSYADIDAAAGYLQAQHPGLVAYSATHVDWLVATGYPYVNLHAVMEPFTYRNSPGGDVIGYMDSESALAAAHNFLWVTNLNGPNGGVLAGPMTAAQLSAWGTHAISLANSSGMFVWLWSTAAWLDGAWFSQSDISPVLDQLAAQAAARGSGAMAATAALVIGQTAILSGAMPVVVITGAASLALHPALAAWQAQQSRNFRRKNYHRFTKVRYIAGRRRWQ